MATYRDDPRWITTRYACTCARCKRTIARGERMYYYPASKSTYCNHSACGRQEAAEFEGMKADEEGYCYSA